jgi:hypothetical protein
VTHAPTERGDTVDRGFGLSIGVSGSAILVESAPAPGARSCPGAAIPSLIAGQLTRALSLLDITVGYAALAAIAGVVVLPGAHNPATRDAPQTTAKASLPDHDERG